MLILVALKYATLYTYAAISGAQTHNDLQTHAALLAIQWLGVYIGALLVTSLATGLVSAGDAEAENDGEDGRANVPEKYPRAYALLVYSAILLPAYTVAATLLAINRVVAAEAQPPKTEVLIDLVFSALAIVFAVSMLYHLQISAVPAWPTRFLLAVVFFCVVLEGNQLNVGEVVVFVVAEALSTVVALLVPSKFERLAASVGALVEYFLALGLFWAVLDDKIKANAKFEFDAQLATNVDFISTALNISFGLDGGYLLIQLFLGVKDWLRFFGGDSKLDNHRYVPIAVPMQTTKNE